MGRERGGKDQAESGNTGESRPRAHCSVQITNAVTGSEITKKRPEREAPGVLICLYLVMPKLELVPEELVVNFVVELHFSGFDEGAEEAGAAVG